MSAPSCSVRSARRLGLAVARMARRRGGARIAGAPAAGADRESVGADRSHRLLGRRRQRGLALPHGDAGQGRLPRRPDDRRRRCGSRTPGIPAADEAAGNQCKSYGAAAIMRVPGRMHITWQDDNTLKLDTDAGTQTRLFRFGPAAGAAGAADVAGRVDRALGTARARPGRIPAASARIADRGDHEHAGRLPAEERRALQRERHGHRILRRRAACRTAVSCSSSRRSSTTRAT